VGITDPVHAIDKGASLAIIRIIGDAAPYVLVGKPGLKSIGDLRGKTVSVGHKGDIIGFYFERMMTAHGLKRGDYDEISGGVAAARYAALKAGVADAAMLLPPLNFHAAAEGYVTLGIASDYVKDFPFTAMAVLKRWASANPAVAKRLLAATDKSMDWLLQESNRAEAIDLLVRVAHSSNEDAEASYDYLRRIRYFETSSKVSRAKLRNLIEAEKSSGMVDPALTVDRLVMPGITELVD
jgi:ABC-type nitrate/sulfonate/bicarbonate transport system substrate-binding protein